MIINIPVSLGELYDKISILEIKKEKMKDFNKLSNINSELNILKDIANDYIIDPTLFNKLKFINEELWDIENGKRAKEVEKNFDSEFIELARSVYLKNDFRANIKKEINLKFGSDIVEEKSYY